MVESLEEELQLYREQVESAQTRIQQKETELLELMSDLTRAKSETSQMEQVHEAQVASTIAMCTLVLNLSYTEESHCSVDVTI